MRHGSGQHRESSLRSVLRGPRKAPWRLVAVVAAGALWLGGCGRGKQPEAATATAPATTRAVVVVVPAAKPAGPLP